MPLSSLRKYLDDNGVKYVVISHSASFTAQGTAALAHIPVRELAKIVVVKLDGELAMTVLPAYLYVDLALLKSTLGAKVLELASEQEFRERFPECDTGSMPAFGNLYGMKVFADESLLHDTEVAFNGCSHRELIRLAWKDFERLAKPRIIRFAVHRAARAA